MSPRCPDRQAACHTPSAPGSGSPSECDERPVSCCQPRLKSRQGLRRPLFKKDAQRLNSNFIQYLAGKPLDQKPRSRLLVDAARPQIEDRIVRHGASGRAVPALYVVGVDLDALLAV